ncbi:single-stranded DNA-binding protein [Segatella maculosa]|uniref:single-stranded DNA-binding protein n=1 Tax=Segatella maculosa TaxID=439703 RepID=UPI0028D8AF07|nr:single-stranded DNA-binding protein [Segatella maculosa]
MNKVMLIGNVGKEPDVRYYDQDQAVAQFPLATTERGYTLQNGTKVPEHTDWHAITVWRGLAKIVEKYVHKGDKLYIEGRIRYRSYDDQKGQRRYVTEILAENMELLTPKPVADDKDTVSPASQVQPQDNSQEATTSPEDNSALPF